MRSGKPRHDSLKGRFFEFDITRQLIIGEEAEDDDIWQLHATFKFPSTKDLDDLGNGNKWCKVHDDLTGFSDFIHASPQFNAVGDRRDAIIEIDYECAG